MLHEFWGRPRRRARAVPGLEPLEARRLLSAALVQDINATNTNAAGSDPRQLVNVNGTLFFTADDGVHGRELWKSDGTAAGTALVADLTPGSGSSTLNEPTAAGGRLFFTFDDGVHGTELWESDGSAAGTRLVKDIDPGADSSGPADLTNVNGTLFFSADDGSHGPALWKSDGTAAGTVPVKQVFASQLTRAGTTLFFVAPDGGNGPALWKSDGTAAGTTVVADVDAGSLTAVNGAVFFTVAAPGQVQLWKSDGTAAGTSLVTSLDRPAAGAGPFQSMTAAGGRLYFFAKDASGVQQVWASDGTAAGTGSVSDFPSTWTANDLTAVGNAVACWLSISDGGGAWSVWSSDDTTGGLQTLYNVAGVAPADLADVNGTLFLAFDPGSVPFVQGDPTGEELYTSHGLAKDINPGFQDPFGTWPNSSNPADITDVNGTAFFTADDGVHGRQLWKSDGTDAGTVMVKDITVPTVTPGSSPEDLTPVGGTLFFSADDGVDGRELWKSNGTAAGTTLVTDINPGRDGSDPQDLTPFNGQLFFTATTAYGGTELWKSDGTAGGTAMVLDINPNATYDPNQYNPDRAGPGAWVPGSSDPAELTVVGNRLFFTADDGVRGREVWQTDGTAAGTAFVADIGPGGSDPDGLTNVNGTLFFSADDGVSGRELWKTDGTEAGTVLVKDINPGAAGSGPTQLTAAGGKLFFYASDGTHGTQLWESDGADAGTVAVSPTQFTGTGALVAVGGKVFFTADDGTHGWGLWRSDGTAAGTALVKGIRADELTAVGGTLYFEGDAGTGWGLWKTDGTAAGTVLIKSARPAGVPATNAWWVSAPVAVGGTLYFETYDDASDSQLWRTDGTAVGTALVQDLPLAAPAQAGLTNVNGTLFFTLADAAHGMELWKDVPNRPPVASAGGPYTLKEGGSLTLNAGASSDPDHDALTYSWDLNGDGVYGDATGARPTLTATQLHALGLDGRSTPYQVRVRVNDGQGHVVTSAAAALTVQESALSVRGAGLSGTEGATLGGTLATFTDPGGAEPAGHYSATIDWGDGTTTAGTVTSAGGRLSVAGKHAYRRYGLYGVRVTVRDDGGNPVTVTDRVSVADAALSARGTSAATTTGRPFAGTVASFTDANPFARAGDYIAHIDWGDGQTSTGTVSADGHGGFTVRGGHTYARKGTYHLHVQVRDAGGSSATALTNILVSDPPPAGHH